MGVTHTGQQSARYWRNLAQKFPQRAERALVVATRIYNTESRKQMRQGIYAVPVPTNAEYAAEKGKVYRGKYPDKPAWRRSGNLRREELSKIVIPGKLGQIKNTMRYARRRHQLTGRRAAPWRLRALKIAKPVMVKYAKAILAGKTGG